MTLALGELDVKRCLTCGQVFRWDLCGNRWLGVDGEHAYAIEQVFEDVFVETTANREDFWKLFRLDLRLDDISRRIISLGPELEPYLRFLPGLRLMRPSSARETMFCFLCSSNNHLPRIRSMVRTLGDLGEPIAEVSGVTLRRFPSLAILAALEASFLRDNGFGYRAETIPRAAQEVLKQGGDDWLEELKRLPYEIAFDDLMKLPGVGPKLADCICLYGLDHLEAAPVDTHLWQAAVREYFPELASSSITLRRYRKIGDHLRSRFGALAGWAHQALFYENLVNWRSRR